MKQFERQLATAFLVAASMVVTTTPVVAQHEGHDQHVSEYAGQESSEIPSLTATELENLRSAAGMGLARAAELNHHPGPKHVLELETELDLTAGQREDVVRIHGQMETDALALGERIIEAERELNMRFRHGHIDESALETALDAIADLRGELRYVHLRAHLQTTAILTSEQIDAYDELRGYATGG